MPSLGTSTISDIQPLCKRKPQVLNAKPEPPIQTEGVWVIRFLYFHFFSTHCQHRHRWRIFPSISGIDSTAETLSAFELQKTQKPKTKTKKPQMKTKKPQTKPNKQTKPPQSPQTTTKKIPKKPKPNQNKSFVESLTVQGCLRPQLKSENGYESENAVARALFRRKANFTSSLIQKFIWMVYTL